MSDEEIENLTLFDPLTGEVLRKVPRFTIYPKSHYVTPRDKVLEAADKIQEELVIRLDQLRSVDKLVEAQRLGERVRKLYFNCVGALIIKLGGLYNL